MSWIWRYEDQHGKVLNSGKPPVEEFPTQADAESWLGENWRDLLDAGVEQVTLLDSGTAVYGPMSLRPAK
jgi:hypothetical protein